MQDHFHITRVAYLPAALFERWRRDLAGFVMAQGLRATLEHVTDEQWVLRYQQGMTPEEAALAECMAIAD